jgi:hypothetical protein
MSRTAETPASGESKFFAVHRRASLPRNGTISTPPSYTPTSPDEEEKPSQANMLRRSSTSAASKPLSSSSFFGTDEVDKSLTGPYTYNESTPQPVGFLSLLSEKEKQILETTVSQSASSSGSKTKKKKKSKKTSSEKQTPAAAPESRSLASLVGTSQQIQVEFIIAEQFVCQNNRALIVNE